MFDFQPTLRGETVELRPLRVDDLEPLAAAASDPEIWALHPDKDRHLRDSFEPYFAEQLASGGALLILDATTGETLGMSRYGGYDAERSEVEIGWTFLVRLRWGGRTNAEVKRLMLDHAFQFVATVVLLVHPANLRSRRAAEKIGAIEVGTRDDGGDEPSVVYELRR